MKLFSFLFIVSLSLLLSSCEFNCSIGKKDEVTGAAEVKDGARIYNSIQLNASGVKVDKAYLLFDNSQRVPDDNFVDFNGPVKMQILIDSGWVEENGKVLLGASEKIVTEKGEVVLEEADLFQKYPDGISVEDSKSIYLSASLKLKEGMPPTSFTVSFRIWDKKGDGFVEGSYKLYSK
ncbi:MAG: hypothetical protein LH619_05280 [Chitinophagaceae bacterium]|nr:hypothetical protein [Chitinophagaceae bacterium]